MSPSCIFRERHLETGGKSSRPRRSGRVPRGATFSSHAASPEEDRFACAETTEWLLALVGEGHPSHSQGFRTRLMGGALHRSIRALVTPLPPQRLATRYTVAAL